jgi:hypothetical protein
MDVTGVSHFGGRNAWRIGTQGRVWTDSQSRTEEEAASLFGRNFVVYTGAITITSDTAWSPMYIKNTGVNDLIIHRIYFDLGLHSVPGLGNIFGHIDRNPTAGGPLINKVPVEFGLDESGNTNFGSKNNLTAEAYKGSQADGIFTASGGQIGQIIVPAFAASTFYTVNAIVIPPQASWGVTNTPYPGTTNQLTNFGVHIYERTPEVSGIAN